MTSPLTCVESVALEEDDAALALIDDEDSGTVALFCSSLGENRCDDSVLSSKFQNFAKLDTTCIPTSTVGNHIAVLHSSTSQMILTAEQTGDNT